MVTAIVDLNITLLSIFFLGSVFGLMSFSHLLSWVLKNYKDATLALLTGFVLGSLNTIWPWKKVAKSVIINGKEQVLKYNSFFPTEISNNTIFAIILILIGFITVYLLETSSENK